MIFTQTPVSLFKKIYPKAIFELENKKSIALTFDDGPIPEVTEHVLDILNYYNIKASFFCVGENIVKYYEVFEKILKNGHTVGNHTYSHLNGWKTSNKRYFEDIDKFNKIFPTKLFRPPYGKIKPSHYNYLIEQQYKIIFWSIITYDYHYKMNKEKCMELLTTYTFGGRIILFHDNIKSFRLIFDVLPTYIEFCQKLNLKFVPLKN